MIITYRDWIIEYDRHDGLFLIRNPKGQLLSTMTTETDAKNYVDFEMELDSVKAY